MGVLTGMTGLSTSRNLELQPTVAGIRFGTLDEAAGRVVDGDPQPEAGLNVKYGVTSNLTADLTFNPDFSQIETDRPQVEVNQRFALFFPELRPFFLEGAEIFQVTAPVAVVHTRTIVDPLYGAKLTGKVGDIPPSAYGAKLSATPPSAQTTPRQEISMIPPIRHSVSGRRRSWDAFGTIYIRSRSSVPFSPTESFLRHRVVSSVSMVIFAWVIPSRLRSVRWERITATVMGWRRAATCSIPTFEVVAAT